MTKSTRDRGTTESGAGGHSVTAAALLGVAVVGSFAATALLAQGMPEPDSPEAAKPYLALAFPGFGALVLIELLLQRVFVATPTGRYEYRDTFGSMASGAVQQVFKKMLLAPLVGMMPYIAIYRYVKHERGWPMLLDAGDGTEWLWWWATAHAITFLVGDFLYYVLHRANHTTFLWLGHSVHHDSDRYNMSTATRQGILQAATGWWFYIPMAFFVPPKQYLIHAQWNTIYQYWVHTTIIRRLGPLELVFMTPSHHRVHHDRRVHKNYGGVLIVWDRLFGSFLDEDAVLDNEAPDVAAAAQAGQLEEKCLFGQRRAMKSVASGLHQLDEPSDHFCRVWRLLYGGSYTRAFHALYRGPGWHTAGMRRRRALPTVPSASAARVRLPDPGVSLGAKAYTFLNAIMSAGLTTHLLLSKPKSAGDTEPTALAVTIVTTVLCQAMILDGVAWAWAAEAVRAVATAAVWSGVAGGVAPVVCFVTAWAPVGLLLDFVAPPPVRAKAA